MKKKTYRGNSNHNETVLLIVSLALAIMSGCKDETGKHGTDIQPEEDSNALPYGVTDTIDGEKVSTECAIINFNLERLHNEVERIASPSMLMTVKANLQHELDSLTIGTDLLDADEKATINDLRKTISAAYIAKCKEYEVPAEGVIDNLRRCIDIVRKARCDMDIIRFVETRRGMLMHLEEIHLCVESSSSKIGEVKRLAQELNTELERKKKQFGLE